jgi:hypothetical protein
MRTRELDVLEAGGVNVLFKTQCGQMTIASYQKPINSGEFNVARMQYKLLLGSVSILHTICPVGITPLTLSRSVRLPRFLKLFAVSPLIRQDCLVKVVGYQFFLIAIVSTIHSFARGGVAFLSNSNSGDHGISLADILSGTVVWLRRGASTLLTLSSLTVVAHLGLDKYI